MAEVTFKGSFAAIRSYEINNVVLKNRNADQTDQTDQSGFINTVYTYINLEQDIQ